MCRGGLRAVAQRPFRFLDVIKERYDLVKLDDVEDAAHVVAYAGDAELSAEECGVAQVFNEDSEAGGVDMLNRGKVEHDVATKTGSFCLEQRAHGRGAMQIDLALKMQDMNATVT